MTEAPTFATPFVACAGWSISSAASAGFPSEGSHLERYAAVLPAVEINSSFYRPHRPATYARWRDSVPDSFRFSVKLPKEITHGLRLRQVGAALEKFLAEAAHLEHKLGCLLVQLPPSLAWQPGTAHDFFRILHNMTEVDIVCEPRHSSWFTAEAAALLAEYGVTYVRADPQVCPLPAQGQVEKTVYWRLHGAPEIYHSPYPDSFLDDLATRIVRQRAAGVTVWCVFDNTASGAALPNALSLLARLRRTTAVSPMP